MSKWASNDCPQKQQCMSLGTLQNGRSLEWQLANQLTFFLSHCSALLPTFSNYHKKLLGVVNAVIK